MPEAKYHVESINDFSVLDLLLFYFGSRNHFVTDLAREKATYSLLIDTEN